MVHLLYLNALNYIYAALIWGISGSSPKIPLSDIRKKEVNRAYEGDLSDS